MASTGYLPYRANTTLVAQPFGPRRGILSGSATPLLNRVREDVRVWRRIFSVSENGVMVYQAGSAASANSRLVWLDRAGKALDEYDPHEATIIDVRLSPGGKRAAFASSVGVWVLDLPWLTHELDGTFQTIAPA
jgi:hypothetical protein